MDEMESKTHANDLFEGKAFVITGGAGSFVFTGLIDAH